MPFGVQTGQLDVPFCINMNPSTQIAVLEDVISSLEGVGIMKFVIMNGHGGNDFRQMLRELQARTRRSFSVHRLVVSMPSKATTSSPSLAITPMSVKPAS
jgi:creatinine amidohydrolase/Fe(II)-dependent formamide hydrolase-like protein